MPDSDVVVAQNRNQLCVWYSIFNAPDRVTLHDIKGDIEDIERSNGRTFVTVDEGVNTVLFVHGRNCKTDFGYYFFLWNFEFSTIFGSWILFCWQIEPF